MLCFWNQVINEGSRSCEELGFVRTEAEVTPVPTLIQTIVGLNKDNIGDKSVVVVQVDEEDGSSHESTNIICSQMHGGLPEMAKSLCLLIKEEFLIAQMCSLRKTKKVR